MGASLKTHALKEGKSAPLLPLFNNVAIRNYIKEKIVVMSLIKKLYSREKSVFLIT